MAAAAAAAAAAVVAAAAAAVPVVAVALERARRRVGKVRDKRVILTFHLYYSCWT